jgi:hypothetical protein
MRRISLLLLVGGAGLLAPITASVVGAWFLVDPPDARTVALGSAGVALDSLYASPFYNPASIASGPRVALTWTHVALSQWVWPGMTLDHAGLAGRLSDRLGLAANVVYEQRGVTDVVDEHGNYLGRYRSYDLAPSVTAAYLVLPSLTAGMTLKGVYSQPWPAWIWEVMPELGIEGGGGAFTVAADAGVQYHPQEALTFGFSVANLGPDLRYDSTRSDILPRMARVGVAVRPPIPDPVSATVTCELSRDLFPPAEWRDLYRLGAGLELEFAQLAFVRLGYLYANSDRGWTWGAGLQYRGVRLDVGLDNEVYAYRNVRFQLSGRI